MPALWFQADGIRGGEKLHLPPVRPLFLPVCAETWFKACRKRRNACAGDREPFRLKKNRGSLEAATQLGCGMF